MKFKASYPRDIGAIATIFLVLILFLALFNLYISFQFRSEFTNYDRNNVRAIANICQGFLSSGYHGSELDFLMKTLSQSFNLEQLVVTDTLGNLIYDSRTRLNIPFQRTSSDHLTRFEKLPLPQEIVQEENAFLFRSGSPASYIYVVLAPSYSVVFGDIFRWHVFYITISLVFTSFLGFFLLRNLFLPMRYVSSLARDFGIEMKKEDFVSVTFREVYKKLKLREQMLVEFSSYIAHEFRNSLGAIIGLARLVEKGKKPASEIVRECRNMEELIARILEYAKPLKLDFADVDLNKVLKDALTRVPMPKRIQVSRKMADDLSLLHGDSDLLAAAIANLLKNAKESVKGKGLIEVETGRADDSVFVAVRDSGCGIDAGEMELIFNPFFSRKTEGMGLGLAYVKKIVDEHGGRIEVVSDKGKGSTFVLRFPSVQE
jgi:signal transduction histidine kinase